MIAHAILRVDSRLAGYSRGRTEQESRFECSAQAQGLRLVAELRAPRSYRYHLAVQRTRLSQQ